MTKHLSIAIALFSFLVGQAQTIVPTTSTNKNILIEKFNGGTANTYAPDADRITDQIEAAHLGRISVLNIHSGPQSSSMPAFASPWGDTVQSQFNLFGFPVGSINRYNFGSGLVETRATWAQNTQSILNQAAVVNVGGNAVINLQTRALVLDAEAYYTSTSPSSSNKFHAVITQDNVPGPQSGASNYNPSAVLPNGDYNHMNLVRHGLTPTSGLTINNTTTGSLYTKQISYIIPQDYNGVPMCFSDLEIHLFVTEADTNVLNVGAANRTYVTTTALGVNFKQLQIDTFLGTVCGNTANAELRMTNIGLTSLNDLTFAYVVNGIPQGTYHYTIANPLSTGYSTAIPLDLPVLRTYGFVDTVEVQLIQINGQANPNIATDKVTAHIGTAPFLLGASSQANFSITFDQYGEESSWILYDETIQDTVFYGVGVSNSSGQTATEVGLLKHGHCYRFAVMDNYGDGICCNFGQGSFSLSSGNLVHFSGGQFGAYAGGRFVFGSGGSVFNDLNQDCTQDLGELGLGGRLITVQPGNYTALTNAAGIWFIDSLPVGNYTATIDTSNSNGWFPSCSPSASFTVVHPDSAIVYPSIGMYTNSSCTAPDVSIHAPFLRPGFSNQRVYVRACNLITATGAIQNPYVVVELDSIFIPTSCSLPFTSLGNNQYRVDIGSLNPSLCASFYFECTLSVNAVLGETLCLGATLLPLDSCALDTIPNFSVGIPCATVYDNSHLIMRASCVNNDSITFNIINTGSGDMTCFTQARIYIDGILSWVDSIQLQSGQNIVYTFPGDGRTWRIEADQHPLHPGNSQPNATIENCGTGSWTPGLVGILPPDDANPHVDIYCGQITGSYDPNDKTGFPLGVGPTNIILPGQGLEYLIRFQNTGTDTAFTVVIRDTLASELNIQSVISGASSHDYSFRIYGQRILEWTFNNIMLPDSNVNEPLSHGFVKMSVQPVPGLPLGTSINNSAAIYFDFNAPIITNTTLHTINTLDILTPKDYIRTQNDLDVVIYPNPTDNLLHIDRENEGQITIHVMDQLGRLILQQSSTQKSTRISLDELPAGVYLLSISDGVKQTMRKVIKQ